MAAVNDQQNDDDNKTATAAPAAAPVAYTMDDVEQKFFDSHSDINAIFQKMKLGNKQHPLYDLTSYEQEGWCSTLTELVLKCNLVNTTDSDSIKKSIASVTEFEYRCFKNNKDFYGLLYFLAWNNARSRLNMLLLKSCSIKFKLSVIVPLYAEHNRIQNKTVHKNGEDFMRRKVRQLSWLFNGIDPNNMDWKLIFVDDGCPNNSGKIAQKLVDDDKTFFTDDIRARLSINFLSEGLKKIDKFINDPNINNTNDSRKGGAVQYGMFLALAAGSDLIMYTDADLSANISQSGLLLADITLNNIGNKRKAVIANRYTKGIFSNSEIMGTFKTNKVALRFRAFYRGKLLPPFKDIYDTQCGFKVFRNDCIAKVLPKLTDYKGMFDMELLIKVFTVHATGSVDDDPSQLIYSTGVVWLHSAAETQFGSFTQSHFATDYGWKHYNQLQQIIDIHNKTYANSPLCDPIWIKFIKDLTWKAYFQICQIAYLTGIDVYNWFPTLQELKDMIAKDYPANAPAFIENPGKK